MDVQGTGGIFPDEDERGLKCNLRPGFVKGLENFEARHEVLTAR